MRAAAWLVVVAGCSSAAPSAPERAVTTDAGSDAGGGFVEPPPFDAGAAEGGSLVRDAACVPTPADRYAIGTHCVPDGPGSVCGADGFWIYECEEESGQPTRPPIAGCLQAGWNTAYGTTWWITACPSVACLRDATYDRFCAKPEIALSCPSPHWGVPVPANASACRPYGAYWGSSEGYGDLYCCRP